jgi:cellulose synthase/poly-beta-1,6-N-acetylglucosamine synthase-like glycosyltransferase
MRRFLVSLRDVVGEVPFKVHIVNVEATREETALSLDLADGFPVDQRGWQHDTEHNIGHAAACNLAAEACEGDTLFFCNADTLLTRGVLNLCLETLWSDETYGVVGPRQVDAIGRLTHAGIFGTLEKPEHRGWQWRTHEFQELRDDCVTVSGALYMMKRHVWDELATCPSYVASPHAGAGAMPKVAHYYSETAVSYHLAAHGYKRVYEGRVTAVHEWHQSAPIGGFPEQTMAADREVFRALCDTHDPSIPHD